MALLYTFYISNAITFSYMLIVEKTLTYNMNLFKWGLMVYVCFLQLYALAGWYLKKWGKHRFVMDFLIKRTFGDDFHTRKILRGGLFYFLAYIETLNHLKTHLSYERTIVLIETIGLELGVRKKRSFNE